MSAQIIMVIGLSLRLLGGIYLHGKPKVGKYHFMETLVGTSATLGLLYWGGFF